MKVAIFGDIHGNKIALEAVLDDIDKRGGVDEYWLLGDYCLQGGDPIGVLELLDTLPKAQFIRGNSDRYLFNPDLPPPSTMPPDKINWLVEVTRSQYWTIGALSQTRWLDWLAQLPIEYHFQLSDGIQGLLVHSHPGSDDGIGFHPGQSDAEVKALFGAVDENLIFVGHTHILQQRKVDDQHILNTGSVGKPVSADTRATYLMMTIHDAGYDVTSYHVPYDTEAVIQQMHDIRFPDAEFMEQFYRGDYLSEHLQ